MWMLYMTITLELKFYSKPLCPVCATSFRGSAKSCKSITLISLACC